MRRHTWHVSCKIHFNRMSRRLGLARSNTCRRNVFHEQMLSRFLHMSECPKAVELREFRDDRKWRTNEFCSKCRLQFWRGSTALKKIPICFCHHKTTHHLREFLNYVLLLLSFVWCALHQSAIFLAYWWGLRGVTFHACYSLVTSIVKDVQAENVTRSVAMVFSISALVRLANIIPRNAVPRSKSFRKLFTALVAA